MIDAILRVGATAAHKMLKLAWFVRRPRTYGAHAVALTREKRLILVKLRYAPGWRLPGGGRKPHEPPIEAALRELREEIGMTAHGEVQLACELEEAIDFKRDTASLVVVRDVEYRPPKWSWEIEQVREVDLNALPPGTSAQTRRWLETVGPGL